MISFWSLRIVLCAFSLCIFRGWAVKSDTQLPVSGRIIGGIAAAIRAAPYIVSIQYNGVHYCGGSILNGHWIVTAAHCLGSSSQVLQSTLVAGSNDVRGTASTTQKRTISYFVVHEWYTGGIAPYDIGLVYTSTAFALNSAVSAVKLPIKGSTPTGTANLYGWGSISTTSTAVYPQQLQVETLPIITLDECENALGAKGSDVHSTNICTGPLTGNVGICTSDSGGPLAQSGSTLIGIVSWGKLPCGQIKSPSVYVKVSDFITWIQRNQVVPTKKTKRS